MNFTSQISAVLCVLHALCVSLLFAGCSATTSGRATNEAKGIHIELPNGTVFDDTTEHKETKQPAGTGMFQSPQIAGAEAGEIGGVKWAGVSLLGGGIGVWLLKIAVGGLLIFSGIMHCKNLELAHGGLMIAIGVGIILIPPAWLLLGILVAAGFFFYSVYRHSQPSQPGQPGTTPLTAAKEVGSDLVARLEALVKSSSA